MNENIRAAEALTALDASPAIQSASDMADAFEQAGDRIARSLERAAQSGELSFNALTESILKDVARLAVSELIEAPLSALIDGLSGSSGQRSGPTVINMTISGVTDPSGFKRSEGQIAASLARAVSIGQKRI